MTGTYRLRLMPFALLALAGSTIACSATLSASQARADQRRDDRGTMQRDSRNQRDQRDPRGDRDARDTWDRRAVPRFDLAFRNGEEDGYKEGLRDGERGERFDPIREKRFRSADHGYDRRYGPRELYKDRYRDGFRRGYEDGYRDGRRYDRRAPGWWPFGR